MKIKKYLFIFVILSLCCQASISADTILDEEKGILIDEDTGLQWQNTYDDTADALPNVLVFQDAIDYCEALVLGGYDDWRLPNINELESTVDRTKARPAIKNNFYATRTTAYISSTYALLGNNQAWFIDYTYGTYNISSTRYQGGSVRCVRDGL